MPAPSRRTTVMILGAALAALAVTACSDAQPPADQPPSSSAPSAASSSPASPPAASLDPGRFDGATVEIMPGVSITNDAAPVITVTPGTAAPESEVVTVLLDAPEGAPSVTSPSDLVRVNYVGAGLSSGKVFDSSFTRGEPVAFALNQVIAGWTQGLAGARAGQRVALVIPADLAYGQAPPPGSGIAPGEALVFVVDVLDLAQAG